MSQQEGLSGLGEFGLIERIRRQVEKSPLFSLGIGDDCAVQPSYTSQDLLTSTDLLLEGVHFNLDWTDFEQLGRKCVGVNVSDIAAMGGTPQALYLGLALPPTLSLADLDRFIYGFVAETKQYGAVLAGGDTCRSSGPLVISVTVQGVVGQGRAIPRSGARCGDDIYVSGCLGDSALALSLLQQQKIPAPELAVRHHCPQARTDLGQALAEQQLATAMIDVSDGLLGDLGHLLAASDKGAKLSLAELPLSRLFVEYLRDLPEGIELALSGGEDYELLFTADPARAEEIAQLATVLPLPVTRIGTIVNGTGVEVLRVDGSRYLPRPVGFDHFSDHRQG